MGIVSAERKNALLLVLIMAVIVLIVAGASSMTLYDTAIKEQRQRLVELVQSQARLIEAVIEHELSEQHGESADSYEHAYFTVLYQVRDAHSQFSGFGETGEHTLAKREGDQIVFLLRHRHSDIEEPLSIPFNAKIAASMQRALKGESGTLIGLDYRGETVLAAYEPIAVLGLGLVAKIDLQEIRAPFIQAGWRAGGITLVLIFLGSWLFRKITTPMVQHIEKSEDHFRNIFESTSDTLMLLDENGFLECNPSTLKMFGCKNREEFLGHHPSELSPPTQADGRGSKEAADEKIATAYEQGTNFFEWTHRRANGEDFPAEVLLTHIRQDGRDILQATVRDISKRKQEEKEETEYKERLEALLDSSQDGIISYDKNLDFITFNPAMEKMSGIKAEEVIGKHVFEVFPFIKDTDEADACAKAIKGEASRNTAMPYDVPQQGKSGVFESAHFPLFNAKGNIMGGMGIIHDVTETVQADKMVRENEEKLSNITSAVNDAIILLDHDGDISFWNREAENIFGYSANEVIGKALHDFLVPLRFRNGFQMGFPKFRETGEGPFICKTLELAALHKDGHEFPIDLSLSALKLHEKWHSVGVVRDITERKQVENTLKLTQNRHDEAQRIAHLGHWSLDLTTNEPTCSEENYRIFMVEIDAARPFKNFLKAMHPEDRKFVKRSFIDALRNKTPFDIEHRLLMKDGSIKWVHERGKTEYAADGRPLRSIGTTLDITERKKAEEALLDSEEQIRLLLDSTAEAIYGIDLNGSCTLANASCLSILGYDNVSELIGKDMHEQIHASRPDGSPYPVEECPIYQSFREGKDAHVDDEVFWRKDGSSFPVSYWSYPIYKNAEVIGAVVTFLDITEQIKARDALAISHEHLRASLEGTIEAVGKSVEARDPYTAGHQQRVTELAIAIAHEMDLDEDRIEGIRMGASIHDIGKIHLPAEILSKPSKLSDIEYSLIQSHPQVGYDILKDIDFPWPVADVAHQHHERLDGSGYPQGLKGDEICLEARIVAVADVVEAISSHRPYRPSLGIDVALDEIRKQRGKLYDPEVVDTCLKLFSENTFNFKEVA
jgi:PAS domain S-box-containing protein/putative nucleotidyltransferase with HDIG domain